MMDLKESMFAAARDGDVHSLKMCVEQLSKDEARQLTAVENEGGLTPLVIACRHGHVDVVEYLIDECGADVEQAVSMKRGANMVKAAPLWWAAHDGHLNVVKSLLSRGANVNSVPASGGYAVYVIACWNGDLEMVKHLVANGADIEADINGTTCLGMACFKDQYQLATYLIQTDVNGRSIKLSLWILAKMFTKMLSKGESVDFEVIMAVFVVAVDDIEAQIKCGENNEMFKDEVVMHLIGCITRIRREMSEEQNKSFVELVRRYVSLHPRELVRYTALHLICYWHALGVASEYPYSVMDVVRLLLDAGADPQAVDRSHDTPLQAVAEARPISLDLIHLLLDRGAHFDARNAKGQCFLDLLAPEDRAQFKSFQYTTLKCLAARAVRKYNIQYQDDQLPKSLVPFVKLH